jgi:uncharacterized protein (DUF697 family)
MMQEARIEERSPFTKMEFDGGRILVEYQGKNWQWLTFDELTVEEITTSAKANFGDDWQKRVAEDLVKVLAAMDCKAGKTASLRLRNLETEEESLIAAAPVTHTNRQQVWRERNRDMIHAMERAIGKNGRNRNESHEQLSPFTKVEFDGEKVVVEYDGRTWQWLALDDLAVGDIVAYSMKKFGHRWQKRIAEDLVEVLAGMDHELDGTVALRLLNVESGEEIAVAAAPMTEANRRSVWQYRNDESRGTSVAFDGKLSPEMVQSFHQQLKLRWAYYEPTKNEIFDQVQQLTKVIADETGNAGLLELQKVIAKGIDGHASVRGWRLPGRCLPFLIESVGDRYVAINPGRESFVDNGYPYIESIEGISIAEWCKTSSVLVAKGSPQLVRGRSLRLLRYIDHWRKERGIAWY